MKFKFIILIFVFFGLSNSNLFGQANVDSLTEKLIIESIWDLREVQQRNEYVISKSNGERKLSVILYMTPEETKKEYYWIKVSEDNGVNFATHYNFYVYSLDGKIMYFDTLKNKEIELSKWRKENEL